MRFVFVACEDCEKKRLLQNGHYGRLEIKPFVLCVRNNTQGQNGN